MFSSILIPLMPDDQATWQRALPTAVGLAESHSAHLHLLTVVPVFGSSIVAGYFPKDFEAKALEHARTDLLALIAEQVPTALPHTAHVGHGWIWQEICNVAGQVDADLIVMASHKREFRDVLLAPNADQVLHHAPMSVMIVR